jgi:uncharacterized membrane protein
VEKIRFRWLYLALPLSILIIAVVSAAVFYSKLPQETGYRFSSGAAVSEASRGAILGWSLGLQILFALIATILVFIIIGAGQKMNLVQSPVFNTVLSIMGNMVAIPQIIIYYAMLDIFLYNIYDAALPALWIFGAAVLVISGIIIAGILFKAYVQNRTAKT